MADMLLHRIPMVAGLGYVERVRRLPPSFTATLLPDPGNRYFLTAVAVHVDNEKVGYLAPEISRRYFEPIKAHGQPVTCPGRCGSRSDHETSGVEVLLDFNNLPVQAAQ